LITAGAGADVTVAGTGTTAFAAFGGATTGGFTSFTTAGAGAGAGVAAGGWAATSLVIGVFVTAPAGMFVLVSWAKTVTIPATEIMVQMEIQAFMEGNFPDPQPKVTGVI
jgi:hypothetical protein